MKRGICALCGKDTNQLSKDHIQPQCGFNERDRTYVRMESIQSMSIRKNNAATGPRVRNIYYEIQPDRPIGGGIYRYTQCKNCNSQLGSAYDQRLGDFCHDALDVLKPGQILVVQKEYRQTCRFPLSILKRVIAMFFSINGDKFVGCHQQLSQFVRDPSAAQLSSRYQFYAAYNVNDLVSHIPLQCRLNVKTGQKTWITQIAHPPFVYVMTIDSETFDQPLTNITAFAEFPYQSESATEMTFRIASTNSCFAGDFRSVGKLLTDDVAVCTTDVMPSYFKIVDTIL